MSSPGGPLPALVDTHAHLDDPVLAADLDAVLDRARAAGVVQVVAVGTTAADSGRVVERASARRGVFATVGVHPNEAARATAEDWARVVALCASPRVVAIGETGLDRYRDRTPFAVQQEWFARHLDLAHDRHLPVVIHCRDSAGDIIAQLAELGRPVRGVLHSFTGTSDEARALLDLGLFLSFAGMITFTNKGLDALRTTAALVPRDRLLVETDSPYLSPHPHRGQSNEPSRVVLTAERLAQLHGQTFAQMASLTTANARALFHLPDDDLLGSPSNLV
jgi:TatD DNase family protein